jgi:hypothetical protein
VRIPKIRFLPEVRNRTRCIRRSSCSSSARSANGGTQTAGTRSRRASSASARASIRSVFAASGANARARRESATCTRQPAASNVSATQAAPLIISIAALTSRAADATRRSTPSRSADTTPSPTISPVELSAHHAAFRVAQSMPMYSISVSFRSNQRHRADSRKGDRRTPSHGIRNRVA